MNYNWALLSWYEICRENWDVINMSDHRPVILTVNSEIVEASEAMKKTQNVKINWLNEKHRKIYSDAWIS